MRAQFLGLTFALICALGSAAALAPNVSSNSMREEVIGKLGKPLGDLKQGQREVLIYKDQ